MDFDNSVGGDSGSSDGDDCIAVSLRVMYCQRRLEESEENNRNYFLFLEGSKEKECLK